MTYSKDLSFIHDQGFGDVAENAAKVVSALIKNKKDKPLVVDLGCGSGIMAKELIKKGFRVYGIDASKEMISLAKKKVPTAKFKVSSYLNTDIPKCNVITSIGEVFNYLFDKKVSQQTLMKIFSKCFKALEDDGVFVFDVMEFSNKISHSRKGYRYTKDWAVLSENIQDNKTKTVKRIITSFMRHGKTYKRTDEIHKVLLYEKDFILKCLKKAGFKVKIQKEYGALKFRPGILAFVCRKL